MRIGSVTPKCAAAIPAPVEDCPAGEDPGDDRPDEQSPDPVEGAQEHLRGFGRFFDRGRVRRAEFERDRSKFSAFPVDDRRVLDLIDDRFGRRSIGDIHRRHHVISGPLQDAAPLLV